MYFICRCRVRFFRFERSEGIDISNSRERKKSRLCLRSCLFSSPFELRLSLDTSMADLGQPIASTSEERQIAIRLSTKDAAYTIPPAKFLVPASWRRYQLSELINKVLENGQSKPTFPRSLPLSSFSPRVLPPSFRPSTQLTTEWAHDEYFYMTLVFFVQ